ncbi:MAG: hypothetical protein R3358_01285 [Woeseiaceae bacterium]|nr:hypothetical protein [Woeseiaceae bacterium]
MLVSCALLVSSHSRALETARMALPEDFRNQSEHLQFAGFGGHNKGTWKLGDYSGDFTRSESRLGVFDPLFVSNKGKSSFTFPAAGADNPLDVACEMRKKSVTIDIVTFDPKKFAYNCDFRRAGALTGDRLILGYGKPANMKERFVANDARVGEAIVDGMHVTLKSVHKYDGSVFSSQAPVGYLVNRGNDTVAAVELTDWNPSVYLKDDLQAADRQKLLVIALAIAVLRDPANSALED